MIEAANKYADVRAAAPKASPPVQTPGKAPHIFIPTLLHDPQMLQSWYWRELKEGGWLTNYLQREKAKSPLRMRAIARRMACFRQNNKSDFRLKAAVPMLEFLRWRKTDKHFWDDDNNLKRLKRDNSEACVFV